VEKLRIQCEHCDTRLAVPESAIGKKLRCPKCQGTIFVARNETEVEKPTPKKNRPQQVKSSEKPKIDSPIQQSTKAAKVTDNRWCYLIMGDTVGPIASTELLQLFEKGRLDSDTPVKRFNDDRWGELRDFLNVLKLPPQICPEEVPRQVQEGPNKPTIEQLDNWMFLVEGLSLVEVFQRLKTAAAKSHRLTGTFSRSGLIRGNGLSGVSFVISVKQTDEGVTFSIDGETPEGPSNFGALFDPTSSQGWGLFAATAVFNSVVNTSSATSVATDVHTLLCNVLSAFDGEHLLNFAQVDTSNKTGTSLPPNLPPADVGTPPKSLMARLKHEWQLTVHNCRPVVDRPMVTVGILLIIVGGLFTVSSLNMNTTVESSGGRVHNIGLMADKQNYLIVSVAAVGIGVTLFLVGRRK
jgi:predicted Zn finger-like uncharacterized protein